MKQRRAARRGLTLIEITISLLIIGLMMSTALVSVNALTDAELRSTSVALAGAIKSNYDRAIMEKRIQRIAFDLDRGVWWVEFTEEAYALGKHLEEADKRGEGLEQLVDEDDEDQYYFDDETDPEVKAALLGGKVSKFQPDPFYGKPVQLDPNLHFDRVWTGMREDAFTSGVVYIHFFPGGYTEPLQMELAEGDKKARPREKEYITIKVRPLTGRVRTYQKRMPAPEHQEYGGEDTYE